MASTTYAQQWLKQAVFVNEFNFSASKVELVTSLPCLALWCATPDSSRSPSGSVLPVAAARVVLPAALRGLDRQRMTAAIKAHRLGG
mgnify:CR=1 FL=1